MKIRKTYSNGFTSTYYQKNKYPRNLSSEEIKEKNRRNALNQKKNRIRDLVHSAPETFKYFFTLTSGEYSERVSPVCMKKNVKAFLDSQEFTYCFIVQKTPDSSKDNPEYHIHGLCSNLFDLSLWASGHKCEMAALYIEPVENMERAITYMIRDLNNIPQNFHAYAANYKRQKSHTEIYNDDNKLIYTSHKSTPKSDKCTQKTSNNNNNKIKNARYVKILHIIYYFKKNVRKLYKLLFPFFKLFDYFLNKFKYIIEWLEGVLYHD